MHQLDRHSLPILETIRQYDTFLESLQHVADLGCGTGEDITWWAKLENYNEPPESYNFNCFAVDNNADRLSQVPKLKNLHTIHDIYDRPNLFPVSIDLMWAHSSLQYSINPLETLRYWNSYMTVNGMLLLSVPQDTGIEYGRHYSRGYSGCYFHYNPINLIYMLAVNGFDCRDAYLSKKFQDPWINMAVYKTDIAPMDPMNTTWYDLIDKNLLHPTIVDSINANGYLRQEEICMPWLDKELYFIDYQSQMIEFPEATETSGVFNKTIKSDKSTVVQASPTLKETRLLKPLTIKSTPPTRKSYKHGK
jgi:SAM-dependent methyltransferase